MQSRRFYSPLPQSEVYATDLRLCASRHDSGFLPSAMRPWAPNFGAKKSTDRGRKSTDETMGAVTLTDRPHSCPLTCDFMMPARPPRRPHQRGRTGLLAATRTGLPGKRRRSYEHEDPPPHTEVGLKCIYALTAGTRAVEFSVRGRTVNGHSQTSPLTPRAGQQSQ